MNNKEFSILGIQQIAIGGLSRQPLLHLWSELFGLSIEGEFSSETENVRETVLTIGSDHHKIELDIMEPIDPDRSPRVHNPPLNHIGLWVDNLRHAVKYLESKGVRFAPGGIRKGASGHDIIFIHPHGDEKSPIGGEGILIELVQAPPNIISKYR
jgi:lactoylglutathione lyase